MGSGVVVKSADVVMGGVVGWTLPQLVRMSITNKVETVFLIYVGMFFLSLSGI